MNLKGIQIKGFRSIEDLTLNECGEFNVIVGKNNAGKSNILLSIDAFFDCLKKGEPVILNPKIGEVIDHHNQDVDVPIEVSILFELSVTERERIIQDIVSEAPQVRNTIENMDPGFHLLVTASFSGTDNAFAYISRMALCNNDEPEIYSEETYRTSEILAERQDNPLAERISRELSKRRSEVSAKEDELDAVIDEETEYVTQRWKDEKLSLVPGDLLLDNVCRNFGVRFKKERRSSLSRVADRVRY